MPAFGHLGPAPETAGWTDPDRRPDPPDGPSSTASPGPGARAGGALPGDPPVTPVLPAGHRRRRWRLGTAGRLAAFHALVIATVLGIVVVQLTQVFAARYRATITRDLAENVTSFSESAAARPSTQSLGAFARSFLATHGAVASDLLVVSLPAQHLTLGTTGSGKLAAVPGVAARLARPPARTVLIQATIGDDPEEVLAAPILQGGRAIGTFVTSGSLAGYERIRTRVLELAIGEGLITLLAAIISIYVLLRRLLGSVRRLTRAAGHMGLRGELGIRLGDHQSADEVGEMAATFDAMIDRIDTAVSVQRRMLADVSHQLRTPLTVARGHLEVMVRGPLDDPPEISQTTLTVIEELDGMRRLVERLLLLGQSLEADFVQLEPVDLRAMLLDLAHSAEVLAPRRWSVGPLPDVVLWADQEKLRGAVLNLVDNAVRATQPTDTIRISAGLEGPPDARLLDIVVDDSGPGIPPSEREVALGRFSRPSAKDNYGSGLGLAIVEAVTRSHGGRATIDDSPLGGCRVTITLPLPGPDERPTILEGP